jgi:hypothetical protein
MIDFKLSIPAKEIFGPLTHREGDFLNCLSRVEKCEGVNVSFNIQHTANIKTMQNGEGERGSVKARFLNTLHA